MRTQERAEPLRVIMSSVRAFFRNLWAYFYSAWTACLTTLPYLISVGDLRKEVTEEYPDPISSRTSDDLPPRSRGLLFNDIDRCTGCRACERICPTSCIQVETEPGADSSKIWVARFDIDFAKCMFCGFCVEVCLPQSLIHSKQYEGSVYALPDLVTGFGRGYVTAQQRVKWASLRQMSEEGDYRE